MTDHYTFIFDANRTWTHSYPSPEAAQAEAERMRVTRRARKVTVHRHATQWEAEEAYADEADFGG